MKFIKRFILRDAYILQRCEEFLAEAPVGGKDPIAVTFAAHSRVRSDEQNNLWWKWLEILEAHTGYTKDELHEFFVAEFLGTYEVEIAGLRREVRCSSSAAGVAEFAGMMNQLQAWAADTLGVVLPDGDQFVVGRAA